MWSERDVFSGTQGETQKMGEREIKSGEEEDYYVRRASPLCTDIATPDGFF